MNDHIESIFITLILCKKFGPKYMCNIDKHIYKIISQDVNKYNYYIEIVKKNGFTLKYVNEQTEEICLEAVKQNGLALEYVKEQTEEICLEAVKRNRLALRHVKKQTEKICLEFHLMYNNW